MKKLNRKSKTMLSKESTMKKLERKSRTKELKR